MATSFSNLREHVIRILEGIVIYEETAPRGSFEGRGDERHVDIKNEMKQR